MLITEVFQIVSAVWIASEITLAVILRSGKTDKSEDKRSLLVLWSVICVSITLGVLNASTGRGFIPGIFPETAYAGLFFVISGLIIRWIAILTLRRYFTVNVAIRKDHKIVDKGIYGILRHPAYSGNMLSFLGLAVYFANWLTFIIILVPISWAFLYRIGIEEEALIAQFGEQYLAYKKKTKRLIPRIW